MVSLPSARIVHLNKWQDADGYGFTLEEKGKKGFRIKMVEAGFPAEAAGIMENDCVIEVNGQLTSKNWSCIRPSDLYPLQNPRPTMT